jgi:[ribosomal protein S5]-alanine N-acetyltransferase
VHVEWQAEAGVVTTFSTSRLRAERMTIEHEQYLAGLHRDPEVMALIGGIRDAAQSAVWLQQNLAHWADNGFGQWMLRDESDELVGRGGLRWIDPCVGEQIVEVGYVLQRSAWGAGLATEATTAIIDVAFDYYAMPQLGGITLEGNDASTRVLEKCGFVFERWVMHPVGRHRFLRLT